ncbi:MAG: N-formylglutamate amidohydrolase [Fibrobacter sp.]|nr:N-formylglutamate amidohydrolase [Fibrobacter sp.]
MFDDFKLIVTCEHARNDVPSFARNLEIPQEILNTHRGYDIGAVELYDALVRKLKPDFYSAGRYSRLFIDLNRSLWNKSVFSEFWEHCAPAPLADDRTVAKYYALRKKAFAYYLDYRDSLENFVNSAETPIFHLAIHSFTPVLDGKERNADVGVLYDSSRPWEKKIADVIIDEIRSRAPELKVCRNYPYQGKTDGLCSALRKISPSYAGFEIEFNQRLFR